MHPETKKLGELLVDAGLISTAQLQEALRQQRFSGGRMGSNLVAMGFISEDVLMDFLAQQTGVPRLELRDLDVPHRILEKIPRRLAEQFTILPVAFKEPKSIVLAMADPLDLNAVDSARFASGCNIEPMVASHSALRQAIAEQYRKLESPSREAQEVDISAGLPVALDLNAPMADVRSTSPGTRLPAPIPVPVPMPVGGNRDYPRDPFFQGADPAAAPFDLFSPESLPGPEAPRLPEPALVIHARSTHPGALARRLDSFHTRTLVFGLIRMLQRRGVLGEDELQRFIMNLMEAGELKDEPEPGGSVRDTFV